LQPLAIETTASVKAIAQRGELLFKRFMRTSPSPLWDAENCAAGSLKME
jgi:hypothetical protein